MESSQLTVPARFVNDMLAIAAERHCNTDELLLGLGINPQDIVDGKALPVLLYGELHHHIIELVQDEWFGMLSGGAVPKGAIRLLCQTVVHCKTLEQAILRSSEFYEVCRGFKVKQRYEIEGDYVTLMATKLDCIEQQVFDELIANTSPGVVKSTLSVWHGLYSWLIGQFIPISDTYYQFADDNTPHKNKTCYHYEQDFIGLRFHKKYLRYPIIQNENSVEDFMRKAPYHGLIKKNPNEGLTLHVKALLAKSIGEDFPNAAEVAEFFHVSVTTLHRRLTSEGCSFQTLKNESRMEAAIHYLNCPDISTATISDLLSFENPSTFYRSFKKWTGVPPGEYRKQLLAKEAKTPTSIVE